MIAAAELAGFFAAHAIWCVADGSTLIPMLAYTNESGERKMERFAHDELGEAVQFGKQKLSANEMDANDATFLYDGRIPIGNTKCDAIIIEVRSYFSPQSEITIAVPYTPEAQGGFLVHKPKFSVRNCDDIDMDAVLEAFFVGVSKHEKGANIWNDFLDESK